MLTDGKQYGVPEGLIFSFPMTTSGGKMNIVEGLNMVSKHTKPSAASPQGGIVKSEASLHFSNLMVVDSKGQASRVGRKMNDAGKLVRYSKKSGEII